MTGSTGVAGRGGGVGGAEMGPERDPDRPETALEEMQAKNISINTR